MWNFQSKNFSVAIGLNYSLLSCHEFCLGGGSEAIQTGKQYKHWSQQNWIVGGGVWSELGVGNPRLLLYTLIKVNQH